MIDRRILVTVKTVSALLVISLLWLGAGYVYAQADPFYLKSLRSGKNAYHSGYYQGAIESFKIAEFGLFEQKNVLYELYLYHALCYYKLGRPDHCREIINKAATHFNITGPKAPPLPPTIQKDAQIMLNALGYGIKAPGNPQQKKTTKKKSSRKKKNKKDKPHPALELKPTAQPSAQPSTQPKTKPKIQSKSRSKIKSGTHTPKSQAQATRKVQGRIQPTVKPKPKPAPKRTPKRTLKPKPKPTPKPGPGPQVTPPAMVPLPEAFDRLYRRTLDQLKSNHPGELKAAEAGIARLMELDKYDPRILYLRGLSSFLRRRYSDGIKLMEPALEVTGPPLRDEIIYYLMRSYYIEGSYGRVAELYDRLSPEGRGRAKPVMQAVLDDRGRSVQDLAVDFSDRGLGTLLAKYPEDHALCADILAAAVGAKAESKHIMRIIQGCAKQKNHYNMAFILGAVDYLRGIRAFDAAVKLILKSRFYRLPPRDHVTLHYELGRLYLADMRFKNALVQMKKVRAMAGNYKKTDELIKKSTYLLNVSRRYK